MLVCVYQDLSDEDDAHGAKQKRKHSKKAKAALKNKKKDRDDDFQMDLSDARFQALFTDPSYAIDPTDPQSKKSPGLALIASEKQRRVAVAASSSLVDGTHVHVSQKPCFLFFIRDCTCE